MKLTLKEVSLLKGLLELNKEIKLGDRYVKYTASQMGLDPEVMLKEFRQRIILSVSNSKPVMSDKFYKHFEEEGWVYGFLNKEKKHLLTLANKELNAVVKVNFTNSTMRLNTIYDSNLIKVEDGYVNIKTFNPITKDIFDQLERGATCQE